MAKAFLKTHIINTRLGFFILLTLIFWAKTVFAYYIDFSLGITGILQHIILILNPFSTTIFILGLALYIRKPKLAYVAIMVLYLLNSILLFANIVYYREFTDFMTLNTILSAGKVSAGLSSSAGSLLQWHDMIYFLDFIIISLALIFKLIKVDPKPLPLKNVVAITTSSILLFSMNLTLSELNRPQLLTRTFDRNYIVKYLGIDTFMVYDAVKTAQNNQVRAQADSSDMDQVLSYVNNRYAAPDPVYFGKEKGKNIIIIHLESFQQFLIDKKINGVEVTPFLNSLYHDSNTLSFSNFFHEVGQGKTSDAENMLETGVFGIPQGSVFTSLGSDNTFQGAPAILAQEGGYSSAVFHGNGGTFWNRNNVYKRLGYQNFFDASYFDTTAGNTLEYGLKDKLLFAESIKYLEQLQQPFYTKFITVTNHSPFPYTQIDSDFPVPDTGDKTVDGYFATAHYLDQSVKEFFDYLKESGLDKTSMVVLYGDHYGISNSANKALAPLLDRDPDTWTDYDNAQLQRVPFMIHADGLTGGIKSTYGGEIDVLPTILHLAGIDTKGYIQFGTDMLSPNHSQVVAFRNNNFITPDNTVLGDTIYSNATGKEITNPDESLLGIINAQQTAVNKALSLSDTVNNRNLLRFYTPSGFTPVDPQNYNYQNSLDKLETANQTLGVKSTSLFAENGNKTTTGLYKTDAPELSVNPADITEIPQNAVNTSP